MKIQNPAQIPPGPDFKPILPNVIHWAAATHGDKELFVLGDRRISFVDAERESRALAKGLLALGCGKGTRVGLLMENGPDWPINFFAAARAGAMTVALSTFYQAPEIAWALRHNDIDTLLISARYLRADYIERLERALPGLAEHKTTELYLPDAPFLRRIVVWGECDRPWALKGPAEILAAAAAKPQIDDAFLEKIESNIAPADELLIICTSGSTAEPKAVVHTHGVCVRMCHEFKEYMDLHPGERSYSGQPFFWIGGINVNLMPSLYTGSTMVFSESPAPAAVVELIEKEKVTRLSLWAAQLHGVLEAAGDRDLSSIRAGGPVPRDLRGNVIPAARKIGGVMGMTENFGMHSIDYLQMPTPPGKGAHWGRHVRGMERKIIDPETMAEVPPGVEGECYIRGFAMMRGYYKKEREEVFTRDGWFATGDLAIIDEDDYIYFTGRRGELVKTSGANVAPREVELALQRYPEVREAIVFGLPDPVKGEKVVAVLCPQAGQGLDPDAVRAKLKEDISPYKVPVDWLVMDYDDIPRTGSLKPQKPQLKTIVIPLLEKP